ncbi:hypothetical protein [Sinorhizobium meliloti]|uniref:hypothetical protein n=1 Tax=Rhizobium meliloti TaxID=382 RepID=UPI0013E3A77E|nr:hypothetical protein [Sinorhizobium meliloti]
MANPNVAAPLKTIGLVAGSRIKVPDGAIVVGRDLINRIARARRNVLGLASSSPGGVIGIVDFSLLTTDEILDFGLESIHVTFAAVEFPLVLETAVAVRAGWSARL